MHNLRECLRTGRALSIVMAAAVRFCEFEVSSAVALHQESSLYRMCSFHITWQFSSDTLHANTVVQNSDINATQTQMRHVPHAYSLGNEAWLLGGFA